MKVINIEKLPKARAQEFLAICKANLSGRWLFSFKHNSDCVSPHTEVSFTCTCEFLKVEVTQLVGPVENGGN